MNEYCQVIISATRKEEANKISDFLVKKKLIAGSLIIKGDSRYWWKNNIVEREYFNVQAFSVMDNKDKIIEEVEKLHSDETPVIAFSKIDGNYKFLNWVRESINSEV